MLTLVSSYPPKSAGLVTQRLISSRTWKIYDLSEVTFSGISGGLCCLGLARCYVEKLRHSNQMPLKTLNRVSGRRDRVNVHIKQVVP